eukprot:Platyproteum_vivax@DN7691_c3_g2_i1.p1
MFSNLMTCWGANNAHPSSVNTPNMNDIFPKPPLKRGSANIKLSSPAVEFWHHFHEEWQALQLDGRLVVESASRHSNPVSPVSAVAHNPKDDNVAADWHIALREAVQQQPAFPLEAGRVRKILERFGWSIEELPSAVSSRIAASLIHATARRQVFVRTATPTKSGQQCDCGSQCNCRSAPSAAVL